jgi:hypothetical protein
MYVYFFLYPADVLLKSVTGIAILGLLHSSNVFSRIINLCLQSSFPWWGFCFILYMVQLFSVYPGPRQLHSGNCCCIDGVCNSRKLVTLCFRYSGSISWFVAVIIVASFLVHFCMGIWCHVFGLFLQIPLVPCKILFLFCPVPDFLQSMGFPDFSFLFFFWSIDYVISSSVFTFVSLKVSATCALISSNQGFDSKPLVTMAHHWLAIRCLLISISGILPRKPIM